MAQVYSVVWQADSRTILDPKFGDARREGDLMRLDFPLLPGRDFAPVEKQLAWCGDMLIHLAKCGYAGRMVPPGA